MSATWSGSTTSRTSCGRPVGSVTLTAFYVLPELRGRGVGRLLMEAAYAEMRQAGATTVALEMVANNDVARRFYEREGFTTTFVQMHRRLGPD
jgi:ribosomal protein S18 acetylase RimI-like enzyme